MIRKENKRVCVAYGKLQQESFSLSPTRGISKVNPQNQRTLHTEDTGSCPIYGHWISAEIYLINQST